MTMYLYTETNDELPITNIYHKLFDNKPDAQAHLEERIRHQKDIPPEMTWEQMKKEILPYPGPDESFERDYIQIDNGYGIALWQIEEIVVESTKKKKRRKA